MKNILLVLVAAIGLMAAGCSSANKDKLETPVGEVKVQELKVTRTFNAPRDVVWKTWTEPKLIKKWWGPKNYTAPTIQNDPRPGGKYLYAMKSPEGKVYWSTGTYQEVNVPELIIATDSFADEKGNVVSPTVYGMNDLPNEFRLTIGFEKEDSGKKTKITLRQYGYPSGDMMKMAETGWNESFDKLAMALKSAKR